MLGYLAGALAESFGSGFVGGGLGSVITDVLDEKKVNCSKTLDNTMPCGALNLIAGLGAEISKSVFESESAVAYNT